MLSSWRGNLLAGSGRAGVVKRRVKMALCLNRQVDETAVVKSAEFNMFSYQRGYSLCATAFVFKVRNVRVVLP